ncbi:MAG: hypothetical protein AAGC65_25100 [Mucilaginibacter sp.]|uniref:hypothetical protein n=1 Tax=Mucilaginibacter sp. TaxID=1882438 RepID=UPI0031AE1E6B
MTKKYILKPGSHQFAPGSAAMHNNDNTTDEEAAWYLQKYPHIASLFLITTAQSTSTTDQPKKTKLLSRKAKTVMPKNQEASI